jgi:3-hydroxyisobutyrate dehydrogenase-like beta-hydroxyacid dehydrogenase
VETNGLIGIGLLGSALAERLIGAKLPLAGYDVDPAGGARLRGLGGRSLESALAVARACRRILLSLPTSAIARAVVEEIEPALQPGAIIIDTTTGDPHEMVAMGARLSKRGVGYVDATVGGSSRQVRAGEAIIMAGGNPDVLAQCADILEACSAQVFKVGPCGAGALMKLVFNLVLGLHRAVLAEGLTFAEACGIRAEDALAVLRAGPAFSRVMDIKGAKMLTGDFTPEARLSQHLKDVRLILATAKESGAQVPLSELHCRVLDELEREGLGGLDNSAVIKAFQKRE